MRIASVTISNFRCFGPEPSTVYLDRLTCLIGANGAGKSAVLQALVKLFGVLPGDPIRMRQKEACTMKSVNFSKRYVERVWGT